MKQFITLLLLSLLTLTATAEEKEVRNITESFTAVEVSKGANLALIQSDKTEIEILTDGCATTDVETTVRNGMLYVRMLKKTAGSAVTVNLYFKDLTTATVKRGASLETKCLFKHSGTFFLNVSSYCDVEMEIESDELQVNGTTCDIEIVGTVKKQNVTMTGAVGKATYDAKNLNCEDAVVKVTESEATIKFSNSLTAEAVSGTVKYIGDDDKVTKTEKLGGKVEAKK